MSQSVNMPSAKPKKDIFDLLINGLQIASHFTDIQKARAQINEIPIARERMAQQARLKAQGAENTFNEKYKRADFTNSNAFPVAGREGLYIPRQSPDKLFDQESKLRKEWFTKGPEQVEHISQNLERMRINSKFTNPDLFRDITDLMDYFHSLEPGITVKQNELGLVEHSRSLPSWAVNELNKLVSGESSIMDSAARTKLYAQMERLYKVSYDRLQQHNKEYERLSEEYGLNPNRIVTHLPLVKPVDSIPNGSSAEDQASLKKEIEAANKAFDSETYKKGIKGTTTPLQNAKELKLSPKAHEIIKNQQSMGKKQASFTDYMFKGNELYAGPGEETVQKPAEFDPDSYKNSLNLGPGLGNDDPRNLIDSYTRSKRAP